MRQRVLRWGAVVVALAGAGSCLDSTGPGPVLRVTLTTPNAGADGAILLTVTGPTVVTRVATVSGLRVFAEPFSTTNHLAVTGPLPNGLLLTLGVPDVTRVSEYVATIQDVAATNYQLRPLTGYSLTISR